MGDSNGTTPTKVDWPARRPRYTLVQISDPHVPADGLLFDRVDACARVQESVEMIAAAECSPDVLVLSGDVANRGEAESYVRLRPTIDAALERFGAKPLVAPGNHDDVALLRAHLLGRGSERGPLDEVVRIGGLRVIGLDSSVPGEDHGELDDAQIAALAGELAEPAPDGTVWVSPSTGSHADVLTRDGFGGHAGGGFTRVDILDDGEIVATFVPLTGRDEILYEFRADPHRPT